MYLDSENWLKCSAEYENEKYQHFGSVVTHKGYSDWATTEIGADRIRFGIYACSPEKSSFKAVFTDIKLTECQWQAHNGQKPNAD